MRVSEVKVDSEHFQAVLQLWRAASDTLGNMPRGGFEDCARDRSLLAAIEDDATLLGYVMFRRSAQRRDASITHLCVAPHARSRGVARLLFDAVKDRCADCYDIRLKCRRDFAASDLWQHLGFIAVHDAPGRGRDGALTTTWRYQLAELPLFRRAADAASRDDRARAVIDANVFFDLDEAGGGNPESLPLTADWLTDSIELQVAAELSTEINRRESDPDRQRQWKRMRSFTTAVRDVPRENEFYAQIARILSCDTPNRVSDARQLAMAAAADALFFVTRDGEILDAAEQLEELLPLRIVRPHELVRRFDELRRDAEYRPGRLFLGPRVTTSLARSEEFDALVALMHDGEAPPERRRTTNARLREMLAAPERFEIRCVRTGDALLAAYVLERTGTTLRVPFFAVAHSSLGRTAARHWANDIVAVAARERRRVVQVDPVGARVREALIETGFTEDSQRWIKLVLPGVLTPEEAAVEVEALTVEPALAALVTRVASDLREIGRAPSASRVRSAEVEAALWPAKLTSIGLPSFVVPIQPRWAKDLFDIELASTTLFGADPSLVLNCENVYYRDARQRILTAPGRVLWYVSDDRAYPASKSLRACSLVEEVAVGRAKDLYRRFRRLGVYAWSDILALAEGDETKEIMAFRFGKTELFKRPVSWKRFQVLRRAHTGRGSPLVSPIAVDESLFVKIYTEALHDGA